MKKICIMALALMLAGAFLLAACQPTPESPVVGGKNDTDDLLEQAQANKDGQSNGDAQPTTQPEDAPAQADPFGLPEDGRCVYDATGADGKLKIHVDAEVVVPEERTMPIYKATIGRFTQEQVTGIFNYFYPDEKPKNEVGYVDTKATIEAQIIELKRKVAEGKFEGTQEEADAMIAMMEQSWADAPETTPEGGVSDGTLMRWELADWSDTRRFLRVKDGHSQLSIDTDVSAGEVTDTTFLTYQVFDEERSYSTRNPIPTDGTDIAPEMSERLGISYEEADAICREFFAAAGYEKDEFAVVSCAIIDDTGADYTPGTHFAYYFLYTRAVEGIPLFADRTAKTSANGRDEAYTVSWPYEKIMMEVDSKGIAYIKWNTPIHIGEAIETDAGLKPYEEVMGLFGTAMKVNYEGVVKTVFEGEVEFEVDVTRMELCLMRIREKGGKPTEGLIVPAWVCFGQCKGTKDGETRYFGGASGIGKTDPADLEFLGMSLFEYEGQEKAEAEPQVLLAINAIDGSVIDANKGY